MNGPPQAKCWGLHGTHRGCNLPVYQNSLSSSSRNSQQPVSRFWPLWAFCHRVRRGRCLIYTCRIYRSSRPTVGTRPEHPVRELWDVEIGLRRLQKSFGNWRLLSRGSGRRPAVCLINCIVLPDAIGTLLTLFLIVTIQIKPMIPNLKPQFIPLFGT